MDILDFEQFQMQKQLILEQDDTLGAPPPASPATDVPPAPTGGAMGGAPPPPPEDPFGAELPPDPNQQPVPEEPKPFKFVFIQDAAHKKWYGQADKDGGVKRFTVYEITQEELDKWLDMHAEDEDSEKIKASLLGKRPMPSSVYSDFKKEVLSGDIGTDKGPIDITFDSDTDYDNPATDDLSVVFLRSSK